MSSAIGRVVVVGGGLVGLATARAIARRGVAREVVLLEKETTVARHQSSHNSGVLHCGLHYRPGSHRAHLAVEGIRRMTEFAERHGIAHEQCGKIVAAVRDEEVPRLEELHRRGAANGLKGLRWLAPEQARESEPHLHCVAALHVPEEGIIDFEGVAVALERELQASGVGLRLGEEVVAAREDRGGWSLETSAGDLHADFVVTCAGLQSDRLARLFGVQSTIRIVPFRGDYFELTPERSHLVRNLIYPVPNPTFPFLGVHLHRTTRGTIDCGPSAVLSFAREGYRRTSFNLGDAIEALGFRGLRRFVFRYPKEVLREFRQAASSRVFARALARLVPEITPADLRPAWSGVRAQALTGDGDLVKDFEFADGPSTIHVLNAPSPAATASLAIGERIAGRLASRVA